MAETIFAPAITAGTPQGRSAEDVMPRARYKYFDLLTVIGHPSETLIFTLAGRTRRIPANATFHFDKDTYGPIYGYSVDATGNVAASSFQVLEAPGTAGETAYERGD